MIKKNWGLLLVLLVISSLFYISLSYLPATTFAQYPAPSPTDSHSRVYIPLMMRNWEYVYYPWKVTYIPNIGRGNGERCQLYGYFQDRIRGETNYVRLNNEEQQVGSNYYTFYFNCYEHYKVICALDHLGGHCISREVHMYFPDEPTTHRVDFYPNPNPPPPTATPTNTPIPSATPTYPPSRTPRPTETRPTPSPTRIQSPYPTPTPIICPILPRYGPSGASEWCFDPPDTFFVRTNMMSIYSYIEIDSALVPQCPGADHVYYQIVHPDRQASPCSFFEDDLTGGEQTSLPLYNYYNYDYYHYSGWQVWIFKQDGEFLRVAYPQYPID